MAMSKVKKAELLEQLEGAVLEMEILRGQMKEMEAREKGVSAEIKGLMEELSTPSFEGRTVKAQLTERERSSLDRGLLSQVLTDKQLNACTKVTKYVQLTVTKRS